MLVGKHPIGSIMYMGGVMSLPEPFCWAWSQMVEYNAEYLAKPNELIYYYRTDNSYHSYARNNLAKAMKGDWLLMLDTDHVFEPDLAARMLRVFQEEKLDVLSGLYLYKGAPYPPKVYRFTEKSGTGLELVGGWDLPKGNGTALVPVDATGGGCLMIRKSVFKRIREELKEEPFDITPPYSEDISFFKRLKKLGIQVYMAPGIEFYHLSYEPLRLDKYKTQEVALGKRVKTPNNGNSIKSSISVGSKPSHRNRH